MSANDRNIKLDLQRRLSAVLEAVFYVVGVAVPLLLLATGLWLVFNLIRFLVGAFD